MLREEIYDKVAYLIILPCPQCIHNTFYYYYEKINLVVSITQLAHSYIIKKILHIKYYIIHSKNI